MVISSTHLRSKVVDIPGLVSVYVALHSLPSPPDLTRSVAITTAILVQRSPDLAKQFIEELSGNVSVLKLFSHCSNDLPGS